MYKWDNKLTFLPPTFLSNQFLKKGKTNAVHGKLHGNLLNHKPHVAAPSGMPPNEGQRCACPLTW